MTLLNPKGWIFALVFTAVTHLGAWADETHRIPGDAEHQDVNSEDLQGP